MIKKTFLLILIVFGSSSCGYTPMLSQNNNFNFNIENLELLGDKTINNILEKKIKQYSNNSSNKKYKISINSNYQKNRTAEIVDQYFDLQEEYSSDKNSIIPPK